MSWNFTEGSPRHGAASPTFALALITSATFTPALITAAIFTPALITSAIFTPALYLSAFSFAASPKRQNTSCLPLILTMLCWVAFSFVCCFRAKKTANCRIGLRKNDCRGNETAAHEQLSGGRRIGLLLPFVAGASFERHIIKFCELVSLQFPRSCDEASGAGFVTPRFHSGKDDRT